MGFVIERNAVAVGFVLPGASPEDIRTTFGAGVLQAVPVRADGRLDRDFALTVPMRPSGFAPRLESL
jgi:hypothetical protein